MERHEAPSSPLPKENLQLCVMTSPLVSEANNWLTRKAVQAFKETIQKDNHNSSSDKKS